MYIGKHHNEACVQLSYINESVKNQNKLGCLVQGYENLKFLL
jgi:hypothetical protein